MVQVPQIAGIGNKKNLNTFVVPVQVQIGGLALEMKALCDTGADISLSMSSRMASQAVERLGARIEPMDEPLQLADYRRKATGKATSKIIATLELDKRRFLEQEFLVIDTGHDVFTGQEWLSNQDVWVHPKTKSFFWPEDKPDLAKYSPAIIVSNCHGTNPALVRI